MLTARLSTPDNPTPPKLGMGLIFNKMPNVHELAEWGRRRAADGLRKDGYFHTILLTMMDCGEFGHAVLFDINDQMEDIDERPTHWKRFRRMIAMTGTDICMVVSEVWSASCPEGSRDALPKDLSTYGLSNEHVMVSVETRERQLVQAYEIHRIKGRPRLGKQLPVSEVGGGNAMNLLYKAPPLVMPGLPN